MGAKDSSELAILTAPLKSPSSNLEATRDAKFLKGFHGWLECLVCRDVWIILIIKGSSNMRSQISTVTSPGRSMEKSTAEEKQTLP